MRKGIIAVAVALTLAGMVGVASAAVEALEIDVNVAKVQAKDTLGNNVSFPLATPGSFTGLLAVSSNPSGLTILNDVQYDGTSQSPAQVPVDVTGSLNFVSGFITGGSLAFVFHNGTVPAPDNTLTVNFGASGDQLVPQAGDAKIIAAAVNSHFSSTGVGGVSVVPWINSDTLAVTLDQYHPSGSGGDDATRFEIIIVPEPASVSMLGLAGAGLLARRRRVM